MGVYCVGAQQRTRLRLVMEAGGDSIGSDSRVQVGSERLTNGCDRVRTLSFGALVHRGFINR